MAVKKIGVMGCGMVANYGHLPVIAQTDGLTLHAIFDPNDQALEASRQKYGVPHAFTDVDAFLDSGIDAVSITSPAPCHYQNVLDAAKRKLPVLCEKPLAMDRDQATAMIAAMQDAGATLYTGFCYRFSPVAMKIRELVQTRTVGEVRSLRLIYNWPMHGKYVLDKQGNRSIQKRREGRMLEGGPMVDCGTHQIDLAMFWLGSPIVHCASHGAWVDEYEAPDHMYLHMTHENAAHTMVEMSYSYHHTSRNRKAQFVYELIGTEGVIRYDRTEKSFAVENAQGRTELPFDHEKSFEGMYAEWAKALEVGHSDLLTTAADGMTVADIAREATNAAIAQRERSRPARRRRLATGSVNISE